MGVLLGRAGLLCRACQKQTRFPAFSPRTLGQQLLLFVWTSLKGGTLREDGLLPHPPLSCLLAQARPLSALTEAGSPRPLEGPLPPDHLVPSSLQPQSWPPSLSGTKAEPGVLRNILWNDCVNGAGLGQFPPLIAARVSLSRPVAMRWIWKGLEIIFYGPLKKACPRCKLSHVGW